jgi:alpha-beta hydrolase superfamily lysophospholipase
MAKIIADSWGTSRAYVYKLAKKGCPIDDLEQATLWRTANSKLGIGSRSKKTLQTHHQEGGKLVEVQSYRKTPTKIKVKTIEQSLKQAIAVEQQSAEAVDRLREAGELDRIVTAINAYNKALQNRLETEKRVLELQEAQKKLIPIDVAKQIIQRAWQPLLTRLRSAPKRAALKANPIDDALAEAAFREEIEIAIAEGQSNYGAAFC